MIWKGPVVFSDVIIVVVVIPPRFDVLLYPSQGDIRGNVYVNARKIRKAFWRPSVHLSLNESNTNQAETASVCMPTRNDTHDGLFSHKSDT